MQSRILGFGLILTLAFSAMSTQAHHSFSATFTDEMISVEGYVEEMSFTNPHVIIYFNVTDENGTQQRWMSEGSAATLMRRRGWTNASLVAGDFIRVTGNSTRNGSPMVSMGTLSFIDPVSGVVLGDPTTEVAELSTEDSVTPLVGAEGLPNLTGAWTNSISTGPGRPGRGGSPLPFNEEGAALQAVYDPVNDPQVQCEPPGIVRQAGFTPHPVRLEQFEDHMIISYEEYGSVRTIYFDDRDLVGGEHSHLGQSIARYEDQKLIVETTHLLANLTSPNGNELTDQATTVETFYRSEDEGGRSFLNMDMVVTDPVYLTAPWTLSWKKPFTGGYYFIEVDCHKPLEY